MSELDLTDWNISKSKARREIDMIESLNEVRKNELDCITQALRISTGEAEAGAKKKLNESLDLMYRNTVKNLELQRIYFNHKY